MTTDFIYKFSDGSLPKSQILSLEEKRQVQNDRLSALLKESNKSSYYSQQFSTVPTEGLDIGDLHRLPALSSTSYVEHMYPYSSALLTMTTFPGGTVSKTGGTTDKPKYAVWGTYDKDRQIEASLPLLEALGLKKGDVVANMLHAGSLYSGLLSVEFETFRMGLTSLPLSVVSPDMLLQVWKDFKFNAMVIQPSTALPIMRRVFELDPTFHVKTVIFGGQSMTKADQKWLKEVLGVRRLASVIASNDGGPFGYQCEHLQGDMHHLMDQYNYVEVVDDDCRPVGAGEVGRILITNLHKYVVPLIRYEIGDVGRIVAGRCPCGRTDRLLEFHGRSKDSFIVGGLTTNIFEFKAAVSSHGMTEMQIILDQVAGVDQVSVTFAAEHPVDHQALLSSVRKRYSHNDQIKFVFEQVPSGTIPRNPVSGKIVALIDDRKNR